jgi:2-keto-4-pentenoate hydratase
MGKNNRAWLDPTEDLSRKLQAAAANACTISVQGVHAPAVIADAYRAQAGLIEQFGTTIGWKVGRKSPDMTQSCAPLFEKRTYPSGASVATDTFRLWQMETEIAFRIARDLPAREEAYTRAETMGAIGEMLACFEVLDSRFAEWPDVAPFLQLSDLMSHGGMVLGEAVPFDPDFDFIGAKTSIRIGEDAAVAGAGNPAGDPIDLVAWLAANRGLKAGDLVTTGSHTGMRALPPGTTAAGTVEGIGAVSVRRNGAASADPV